MRCLVRAFGYGGLAAVTTFGCSGQDRQADPFATSVSGPTNTSVTVTGPSTDTAPTSTDPGDSDNNSGTGDDSDSSGLKLDVGGGMNTAGDGGDGKGCDKVDFLFVIDNSGSMSDEQANLIDSFDDFIETIQQTVQAQDYHIMVVSTDDGTGGGSSIMCTNGECSCTPVPACCEQVCNNFGGGTCNGFDCDNLPGGDCETTLGAGKIYEEDGTECMAPGGPRYMADTDPNLVGTFSCAAHVGTYGDGNERPMEAMLEATSAALNGANGCNEGFLRDDAILVVTFITDEEDAMKSPGDPQDWYDGLIANKNGNPDAVSVLGLFGDGDLPNALCPPLQDDVGAEPAPRLRQFVELFGDRGVTGSICADDYIPFFLEAVGVVDHTCDEFTPEG